MALSLKRQKGTPPTVQRFRDMGEFVAACERREISHDLVSPGWAASHYSISRQAVHDAIWCGRVRGIYVEGGYVFLSRRSCERAWGGVD